MFYLPHLIYCTIYIYCVSSTFSSIPALRVKSWNPSQRPATIEIPEGGWGAECSMWRNFIH